MTVVQGWAIGWIAVFVIALVMVSILVLRMRRDSSANTREANIALMETLGKDDPLFAYVSNWRVGYSRQAGGSMNLYYVLTGTALIATSLVTAVSALGGVFPEHAAALLIATTALGLIATVAQGLDRMLNDRKDFIRMGRYSTLLEIEGVKFLDAYVRATPDATGKRTVDPDVRKAFVDAVCKIRADELADWIQDETSATVDLVGPAAGATAAQQLGAQERAAFDADRAAQTASVASDDAGADAALKTRDLAAVQAAYDAAVKNDPAAAQTETQTLAQTLAVAKKAADDARARADAKKTEADRLRTVANQKHADLTKVQQPAPSLQTPTVPNPNKH